MPDGAGPGFSKVAFAYAANNFRRGVPETLDALLEVVLASRVDGVRLGSPRWRESYLLTHVKNSSISLLCLSAMAALGRKSMAHPRLGKTRRLPLMFIVRFAVH
jgi:hypothetical protein